MDFDNEEYRRLIERHNPHRPQRSYGTAFGVGLRPREKAHHRNLLDIEDIDVPIYRILSVDRLISSLQTNTLALTRVALWDDPFENFALRAKLTRTNGESISLDNIHAQYFGQCWTLQAESDGMWRIYSSNTDGIKVKTTPRKLFDAFYNMKDKFHRNSYFMGLVRYLSIEHLQAIMNNSQVMPYLIFDQSGSQTARALLTKRFEFSHEQEVRLIRYIGSSNVERANDYPVFHVDPNTLFDEIVVDPRCDVSRATSIADSIRAAGYSGPVSQSQLYQFPTFDVPLPDHPPFGLRAQHLWDELTGWETPPDQRDKLGNGLL